MVGTVNSNREHFEAAVADLAQCEFRWPGWLSRLLTHRVAGLENHQELTRLLMEEKKVVKVVVDVAQP